jgi:hypothetical protein
VKFNLTQPCASCPFRTDIAFCLARERRSEIAAFLLFGDATFACHNTVDYSRWEGDRGEDEDADYIYSGDEQHCAGALITLKRMGALWGNVMFRLAAMGKMFDPEGLRLDAQVFDSMDAFVEGGEED